MDIWGHLCMIAVANQIRREHLAVTMTDGWGKVLARTEKKQEKRDPAMVVRHAVVELRRSAPLYIDQQGAIAQRIKEHYGSVNFEPGPITMLETIRYGPDDGELRASVNGYQAVYSQTPPETVSLFSERAREFFTISEAGLKVTNYDRVGVLFSFGVDVPEAALAKWFSTIVGPFPAQGWGATDFNIRFARPVDGGEEILVARAVYTESPSGETEYRELVRIDVDRALHDVSGEGIQGIGLIGLYDRANEILTEFLESER